MKFLTANRKFIHNEVICDKEPKSNSSKTRAKLIMRQLYLKFAFVYFSIIIFYPFYHFMQSCFDIL